ncbi:MAG: hypothetical protein R3Y64_09840 [Peptostreptococcaceae bacterium]
MSQEVRKESKSTTLKSKNLLIIISVIAVVVIGACFMTSSKDNTPVGTEIVQFQILDDSVLNDPLLKSFVESNQDTKGTYHLVSSNATYFLITEGETTRSNVGILLRDVTGSVNTQVDYSVITTGESVEIDSYIPKMIIRIPHESKTVKFNLEESNF